MQRQSWRLHSTPTLDYGRLPRFLFEVMPLMVKYLLLIGGTLLVYWIARAGWRRRQRDLARREEKAATEDMVRCVTCGVHLPRGESLTVGGQFYCCADHQRERDTRA
jgi:uncharacterized protein